MIFFKTYTSLFIIKINYLMIIQLFSRKILAAACEKKSIMLFDPVTQRYITSIKKAHNDCVNCIK